MSISHRIREAAETRSRAKHSMEESYGEQSSKRRYQATVEPAEEEGEKSGTDDDSDEGEGKLTSVIRERSSRAK
jgi:hypothetical protein